MNDLQEVYQRAARLKKAEAVANVLQAHQISSEVAALLDFNDWCMAAASAGVKPLSNDTKILVVEMLRGREDAHVRAHGGPFRKFGGAR